MAIKKFTCPPQASAQGSFSDNLVGFQLTSGGGLTQGNFEFTTGVVEKVNRTFNTGTFSDPISLDSLGIGSVDQSKLIFENNFKVYPNFDLSQITNFVQYGSMSKRMSTSITTIISKFPAAIEVTKLGLDYTDSATAYNIVYYSTDNQTSFEISIPKMRNPFGIDFTVNATRNLQLKEMQVSQLRNMAVEYANYSLYVNGVGYNVKRIIPTDSLSTGVLKVYVEGQPFTGVTETFSSLIIRPNDQQVEKVFNEDLDEVENFLLNRNISPVYTAAFKVPLEADDGRFYVATQNITWTLDGKWNLDIRTPNFTNYIETIGDVSSNFDGYLTNLVSRFLVTGAFKDFDTDSHKVEKMLQIYGRSFDETKKYITALGFMNSVNYNIGNDIPSQLLKNLAQTLGFNTDISPITESGFLDSVFGQKNSDQSNFTGVATQQTPDQLNYQYYRNLCLNAAFLFKSKGTRKAIEVLMRLIGAPDALVDFNEYVYVADQKIKLSQFNTKFANISGGTYLESSAVLDPTDIFSIFGTKYTGFTTNFIIDDVNIGIGAYPVDNEGYPTAPDDTENYFFQIGSGWFESTPKHRSPAQPNLTTSVFTGSNPNYQTSLIPYTYGQIYLDKYRKFPYMDMGFKLTQIPDNNKSWTDTEIGLRENLDGNFNARYYADNEKLVLNAKNIDLFMNPGQGLLYDVWEMSRQYNYPIPNQGLNWVQPTRCNPDPYSMYPSRDGVDWTEINPQPRQKTFFEFAQTFWQNTINVRNRQYFGSYPTLESIYWRYLQSEEIAGISNNNYNYQSMMEYVQGMGDYWIRLVEQMIPATTLWNTGVKYENSIFHRQKYVWRRQAGCQLVPVPCKPCTTTDNIYSDDCPVQTATCNLYPWSPTSTIQSFAGILGNLVNKYLTDNNLSLNTCISDSINSTWYVDIRLNGLLLIKYPFYNGVGYNLDGLSYPSNSEWYNAINDAMLSLSNYGYGYYLTDDNKVVVINNVCSLNSTGIIFEINVGIDFTISCS
jgi:hypothetical protein